MKIARSTCTCLLAPSPRTAPPPAFQTWQLKELRDKGAIDFYETRPREVILYWRALPPSAKKDVDLDLLAAVPGHYEAPATSAYLYYTAEDKAWTAPVQVTVD